MNESPDLIHKASREGDLETVRKLVEANPTLVDLDDRHNWRPVFHAALHRQLDVVRFLIQAGADLSAHDGYVVHYAAEVPNNKEILTLLIQYGALETHVRPTNDLSRQFLAALFLANQDRVASLISRHPHLANTVDGTGDYPIHHASRNGDTEIVRILIQHGADVNAISSRRHTVLYCAGGHGHAETVKLLLQNGADADARFSNSDQTLLEWLAQFPDDKRLVEIGEILANHSEP